MRDFGSFHHGAPGLVRHGVNQGLPLHVGCEGNTNC